MKTSRVFDKVKLDRCDEEDSSQFTWKSLWHCAGNFMARLSTLALWILFADFLVEVDGVGVESSYFVASVFLRRIGFRRVL